MKIAIMTQPLGKNYGGMMQAYALQKILRDLGHDVTTIDYNNYLQPSFLKNVLRLTYRSLKKFLGKRKAPINLDLKLEYVLENTHNFIQENISLSESINTEDGLINHFDNSNYHVVIVGSDQTWRPKYSPNIYNYFLSFLKEDKKIQKIAYASSFGVDDWEFTKEETLKCSILAPQFDAISVREESAVGLCKKYLSVESECVVDPTLLLSKEDYIALLGSRYNDGKEEGVFTYVLDRNEGKKNIINNISNKLSLQTFSCQANCSLTSLECESLDDYKMPAVEDWLASFANAKFVITDSFHGVIFSIIFNKKFIAIGNVDRGLARFKSLLTMFHLESRLVLNESNITDSLINDEIDWSVVSNLLGKNRQLSKEFLINSIKPPVMEYTDEV
jgi:hypothetical protein